MADSGFDRRSFWLQSLCFLFSLRLSVGFCMWVSCLVAACLTTTSLLQTLIGDIDNAMRTFLNYYTVWKQFGGLPEFYNIPQGYTVEKREGYPLRPGKQHLWPTASPQALILRTSTPRVSMRLHASQVLTAPFFPICFFQRLWMVFLLGIIFPPYFQRRKRKPGGLKWLAQGC